MNLRDISVIVTTRNEAANLPRCLESVRGFGEIIVVDSFSGDDTVQVARRSRATVFQRAYRSPSDQKNWAAARASHDWVLVLDADEWLTDALRAEIEALAPGDAAGFWIYRRSEYLGRPIRGCGWQRDKVLRLYDRRRGHYPEARVHEEVELRGRAARLRSRLGHRPYRDIAHHIEKIDDYTARGARQAIERGLRAPWLHLLLHPPFRFVRMYILQLGIADGYPGLVLCLLSSAGVFLKYARAWELKRAS
ncbi:MAG TPA: glycosyltransferase family 2 protein [Candidatus Krumholzibacteria bacterium]|nr:glycosyltransferase family 2 protein [Candidatus Krumholzibacteria bacterium]